MLTEAQIAEGWFVLDHQGTPIWGRTIPASGSGTERDVVLIHGAGAHLHWWDAMLAHVGRPWRTTVFDLSGHGRSGHRPDGYRAELWADEVATVIARQSLTGSATVVAHSMGGLIATAMAAQFPERIDELIPRCDVSAARTGHRPRATGPTGTGTHDPPGLRHRDATLSVGARGKHRRP